MKRYRRNASLLSGAALLLLLSPLASAPARADVLTPIRGSYSGHFNDMESFYNPTTDTVTSVGATGNQNFGIDVIGSISSSSGGLYGGPGTGDYLVGVFGGITIAQIYNSLGMTVPAFGPGDTAYATGGVLDLYEIPKADFTNNAAFNTFINSTGPSGFTGTATACTGQTVGQVAAGTSLCYVGLTSLAGVTNVLDLTFQNSYDISGNNYTLSSNLSGALVGSATTWADVTGGKDAAQFQNLTQPAGGFSPYATGTLTDVSLIDDFCPEAKGCASLYAGGIAKNWAVASSDPFNGTTVPEPSTLAIFGSSLLGFVFLRRWRQKRLV